MNLSGLDFTNIGLPCIKIGINYVSEAWHKFDANEKEMIGKCSKCIKIYLKLKY